MNIVELRRDIAIASQKRGSWPDSWWLVSSDFAAIWVECFGEEPSQDNLPKHYLDMAGCIIRPVRELNIDLSLLP